MDLVLTQNRLPKIINYLQDHNNNGMLDYLIGLLGTYKEGDIELDDVINDEAYIFLMKHHGKEIYSALREESQEDKETYPQEMDIASETNKEENDKDKEVAQNIDYIKQQQEKIQSTEKIIVPLDIEDLGIMLSKKKVGVSQDILGSTIEKLVGEHEKNEHINTINKLLNKQGIEGKHTTYIYKVIIEAGSILSLYINYQDQANKQRRIILPISNKIEQITHIIQKLGSYENNLSEVFDYSKMFKI